MLCDNVEESDEFNVQCIKNACTTCGELLKFPYTMDNIDISTPFVWNRFEYEIYRTKNGEEFKKKSLRREIFHMVSLWINLEL